MGVQLDAALVVVTTTTAVIVVALEEGGQIIATALDCEERKTTYFLGARWRQNAGVGRPC